MISKQLRQEFFENTPCLKDKDVKTIYDCAWWAYTDLSRSPLAGIKSWEDKAAYREDICRLIKSSIEVLLEQSLLSQDDFDAWHKNICEAIIKETKERNVPLKNVPPEKGFYHGMAQAWVNITLKNMIATDRWERLDSMMPYLHSPITNKIILIAEKEPINVKAPDVAWSQLSYKQYIEYQNALRHAVKQHTEYSCLMEWDFAEWKYGK